jgi:hypothetical protein
LASQELGNVQAVGSDVDWWRGSAQHSVYPKKFSAMPQPSAIHDSFSIRPSPRNTSPPIERIVPHSSGPIWINDRPRLCTINPFDPLLDCLLYPAYGDSRQRPQQCRRRYQSSPCRRQVTAPLRTQHPLPENGRILKTSSALTKLVSIVGRERQNAS